MKIFVAEGDELLLLQYKRTLKSIFLLSYIYLILKSSFLSVIFIIILLPILIKYLMFSFEEIVSISFFVLISRLCATVLRRNLYFKFKGIKLYIMLSCLAILLFVWIYSYFTHLYLSLNFIQLILSLIVFIYYSYINIIKPRVGTTTFEFNMRNESKALQFLLSKSALLGAPDFVSKRDKKFSNITLIIGKNHSIFKKNTQKNAMTELIIKCFIRNKSWLMMYYQIIGVGFAAIWIIPLLWLKVVVCFILIGVLYQFCNSIWTRVFLHPFFSLFSWSKDSYSSEKCTYILMFPGVVLLSGFLGYIIYLLPGLMFFWILGILMMYTYIKLIPTIASKYFVMQRKI